MNYQWTNIYQQSLATCVMDKGYTQTRKIFMVHIREEQNSREANFEITDISTCREIRQRLEAAESQVFGAVKPRTIESVLAKIAALIAGMPAHSSARYEDIGYVAALFEIQRFIEKGDDQ